MQIFGRLWTNAPSPPSTDGETVAATLLLDAVSRERPPASA
jgi:hypothetical protein